MYSAQKVDATEEEDKAYGVTQRLGSQQPTEDEITEENEKISKETGKELVKENVKDPTYSLRIIDATKSTESHKDESLKKEEGIIDNPNNTESQMNDPHEESNIPSTSGTAIHQVLALLVLYKIMCYLN